MSMSGDPHTTFAECTFLAASLMFIFSLFRRALFLFLLSYQKLKYVEYDMCNTLTNMGTIILNSFIIKEYIFNVSL